MKRYTKHILMLLLVMALTLAFTATVATAGGHGQRNFRAHLNGGAEVPPVDSDGQGQAIVQISKDESSLSFKLIAANIDGVTQAHIHCGPADDNGPVVAFLFGFVADGVAPNGILSEGTITNAQVIPRPDSAACPGGVSSLADVISQMRAGNTYVNVHTIVNPPGEIRGQLH